MQNNYLKQILLLLIATLILSSCGAKKTAPVVQIIPDWYLQPAKYITGNLLYGAGTSENLEVARKRALKNMSYNLQLQIQSSSVSQISSKRDTDNKVTSSSSFRENIALNTKKLTFTKVKDYKIEQVGVQYYAVLTTSYADLITDNKNKLDKNITSLKDALLKLDNKTALQKIIDLSKTEIFFLASLNAVENLEVLQIAYKNSAITLAYLQSNIIFLRKYKTTQDKAKSQVVFRIEGEKQWSTTKNILANNLQSQGYKLGDKYNSIIKISGKKEQHLLFDGKIKQAKIWILIELKEPNNNILASKEFALQATSLQTEKEANRKAQNNLQKHLDTNIFKLLGL